MRASRVGKCLAYYIFRGRALISLCFSYRNDCSTRSFYSRNVYLVIYEFLKNYIRYVVFCALLFFYFYLFTFFFFNLKKHSKYFFYAILNFFSSVNVHIVKIFNTIKLVRIISRLFLLRFFKIYVITVTVLCLKNLCKILI